MKRYWLPMLAALCGGCAAYGIKDASIQARADELQKIQQERPEPKDRVMVIDDPYVDVKPLPYRKALPAAFQREVSYRSQVPTALEKVLRRVQELTGIEVLLESVAPPEGGAQGSGIPFDHPSNFLEGIPPTEGVPLRQVIEQLGLGNVSQDRVVVLDYQGPVRGLFDEIAIQTGLQWRWDERNRKVLFFDNEVAWFYISAGATSQSIRARIGGTGGGGGQFQDASTAQIEYSKEASVAVMEDVETIIRGMLSKNGRMAVVPRLGYVAVRDTPERIDAIRQWVERFNAIYEQQIHLVVDVYRVEINESDGQGVQAAIRVFENLADERGVIRVDDTGFNTAPVGGANSRASVALRPNVPGARQPFGGSTLVFNALRGIGKVSHDRQVVLTTVPGRPVPYRVVQRIAYVASASETIGGIGGIASTQLQPAQIEVGLQMLVTPRIHPDGNRLHVHSLMSLSSLEALEEFSSGNQRVQTPRVSTVEYAQEAWLRNGEVLLVTGLHSAENKVSQTRGILSFVRTLSETRSFMVVTITPVIIPRENIQSGT